VFGAKITAYVDSSIDKNDLNPQVNTTSHYVCLKRENITIG
jgi:hypothetical protein